MSATCAVIPAAGLGKRLNSNGEKVFTIVGDKPLIAFTIQAFEESPEIADIVVVVRAEHIKRTQFLVAEHGFHKVRAVIEGGQSRQDSVRNGLAVVSPDCELIAIHDGARPFVTQEIISSCIATAKADGAAIASVPVSDSIKSSTDDRFVASTLDRNKLYAVQTPQVFRREIIVRAYQSAYTDGFIGTDDASLVERVGFPVRIVLGSHENIKVTTPIDLSVAESILRARGCRAGYSGVKISTREFSPHSISITADSATLESPSTLPLLSQHRAPLRARVGHGYDIHRFSPGRKLFLGGIEFPGEEGLLGHSDADVILHAVADALLGAVGAGDIGQLFPNTDPAYKNIRSTTLLERVAGIVVELGWKVENIDVSVIAERPHIAPHVREMKTKIGSLLNVPANRVSVKASSAEGLGPVGEGLAIECHAIALLYPIGDSIDKEGT